ncbi:decapping and exoribonuclease protein-like isoform X1 [Mya arenaria]|uniref:decapping and exoribonuclease protein-like isoform X1 n=1 Tax=Mya arenaria TaxID=6604 RepID=UPI0022E6B0AC|nr:decapping and exoribonuclease protein-like isoform X1 [Mya arenaria]
MARFNTDIGRFDYPNSGLNRPEELGCFSLDINREFHDDTSQRKYFIKPSNYDNVSFDLTKGYEGMVKRDEFKDEQIDHLLKWINNHELGNMQTHFICRRGLLNRLMRTMYAKKDDWKFAVSLHKGTYYLCECPTDQSLAKIKHMMGEKDEEMCGWGYKFEQYLTASSADSDPSPDLQYNNCETFYTVVKATIGSHTLVYSGEVDAVSTDEPFGEHYVEFKTITHSALQRNSFKRYKLRNWWTQSVLVGVPEIVCGLRDDAGIVTKLQTYTTQDLPTMASDIPAPWKPNVCFNFLDKLLDFIKSNVTIDDPRLVHLLEFSGRDATCNRLPRDSEYAFLHKWYTHN